MEDPCFRVSPFTFPFYVVVAIILPVNPLKILSHNIKIFYYRHQTYFKELQRRIVYYIYHLSFIPDILSILWYHFLFFFFCCCAACGILLPWPGIEPRHPVGETQSPKHWTTMEFPGVVSLVWRISFTNLKNRSANNELPLYSFI